MLVFRYGYAIASAIHGVGNILHKDLMIQVGFNCRSAIIGAN